ncbi:hypothetical protein [Staphylococcus chromogenes]|nr:hypothetical protein [Staphylococcus chromogenes]
MFVVLIVSNHQYSFYKNPYLKKLNVRKLKKLKILIDLEREM